MSANLVKAMLSAQADRRTGVFEVLAEGVHTQAYFARGAIVFAQGGGPSDSLGRVLVREGKLTTEQYTAVIERMASQTSFSEPMRFGEIVVELRFLRPEQVHEALAAQVRQKAIACLMAHEPQWTFRDSTEWVGRFAHFPSSVEPLVLAAAKLFEAGRIGRLLALERESYPRLFSDAGSTGLAFKFGGPEQRFVERIDGATSTRHLMASCPPGSADGGAVLAALVLGDFAELSSTPKDMAAVQAASAQKASSRPIARVHLTSAPRPAPSTARAPTAGAGSATGDSRSETKEWQPADPAAAAQKGRQPTAFDVRGARLKAEEAFQKGKIHLGSNALNLALPALRSAVELCPDAPEFALYLRWAEFLGADEESRPATREALKQLAGQAVKQAPHLAFGFFVLGWAAMMEEQGALATRFFRQALKLDPDLLDAERYLRILRSRADSPAAKPPKTESAGGKAQRPPSGDKGRTTSTLALIAAKVQEALAALQTKDDEAAKATDKPEKDGALSAAAALAAFKPPTPAVAFKPPTPAVAFKLPTPAALPPEAAARIAGAPSPPAALASSQAAPTPQQASAPTDAEVPKAAPSARPKPQYLVWLLPVLVLTVASAASVIVYGASAKHRAVTLRLPSSEPRSRSPAQAAAASSPQVPTPAADSSEHAASAAPRSAQSVLPSPSPATSASSTPDAAVIASAAPGPATSASPEPGSTTSTTSSVSAPRPSPTVPTNIDDSHGFVLTPPSAAGHRIFIDGRVAGEAPIPVGVRCGAHTIKVGSAGQEQDVDVPCGGTVTVRP